jgi:hypothetical protein
LANVVLIERGRPRATLVVPPGAEPVVRHAAAELQEHFEKIAGARLPESEATPPRGPAVLLGRTPEVEHLLGGFAWSSLNEDGLLAAADELCRQRAVHRAVLRERQYLAAVDVCRAELGVDGFTEIWSQGVDLTWPQAVATALELTNAGV